MKYMGSKNRIAKHILPIMLKNRGNRIWIEPFVGGGNMIDKVDGERIGADSNKHCIAALKTIRDSVHLIPKNNKEFTEEDYKLLKNPDSDYIFKGFAGFAYSYSGKWLGGWCRDKERRRDYVNESYKNAIKQSPNLQGVTLIVSEFFNLDIPPKSIIYCDPPYQGTTKYKVKFDHELFWEWCREKHNEGHIIYVSEYAAPKDFKCIWEKPIKSSLTQDTGAKIGVECLFTI